VSIVTIVRNGAKTFLRTAESVLNQDYPNLEYIVVDGASTDGTLDLIRSTDQRIAVWVSEPDSGISDAFNKGIALSRGQIIGLINSDDWYTPGAISSAVKALAETGSDICYGKLQYDCHQQAAYIVSGKADRLGRGMTIGHPTVFIRRDCYQRFGLFRLDYRQAMDYEWLLRARINGAHFSFVDRCLAHMQGGGIGDRRWLRSQMEVAMARAMHCPTVWAPLDYWRYLCWAVVKGLSRRALDAAGLSAVRSWYHKHYSALEIEKINTNVCKESGKGNSSMMRP
jgi:glycosyltransferase involved in cell wall biosynthesis